MWIPKYKRDALKGVDSPIPTQVVSNEEILPRPQNKKQQQVEHLIGKWGAENAEQMASRSEASTPALVEESR